MIIILMLLHASEDQYLKILASKSRNDYKGMDCLEDYNGKATEKVLLIWT